MVQRGINNHASKRSRNCSELKPDRRYQSVLVQRLINKSMLDGKKLAAERAVYTALETAAKKLILKIHWQY